MAAITSEADLRALHPRPKEWTLRKQLDRLDRHCRRFIELSPFVVMATADADGRLDATPRGGEPGFVTVADDRTLLLPDRRGNNRLDSLGSRASTGPARERRGRAAHRRGAGRARSCGRRTRRPTARSLPPSA